MKKQRLTFRCWKCERKFPLQREITPEQEWFLRCPYCRAELLLKLEPFKKKKTTLVRGAGNADESPPEWEYEFPPVIDTQPREEE